MTNHTPQRQCKCVHISQDNWKSEAQQFFSPAQQFFSPNLRKCIFSPRPNPPIFQTGNSKATNTQKHESKTSQDLREQIQLGAFLNGASERRCSAGGPNAKTLLTWLICIFRRSFYGIQLPNFCNIPGVYVCYFQLTCIIIAARNSAPHTHNCLTNRIVFCLREGFLWNVNNTFIGGPIIWECSLCNEKLHLNVCFPLKRTGFLWRACLQALF